MQLKVVTCPTLKLFLGELAMWTGCEIECCAASNPALAFSQLFLNATNYPQHRRARRKSWVWFRHSFVKWDRNGMIKRVNGGCPSLARAFRHSTSASRRSTSLKFSGPSRRLEKRGRRRPHVLEHARETSISNK